MGICTDARLLDAETKWNSFWDKSEICSFEFHWYETPSRIPFVGCTTYWNFMTNTCLDILSTDPHDKVRKHQLQAKHRLWAFEGQLRKYLGISKDIYVGPFFACAVLAALVGATVVTQKKGY